MLMAYYCLEDGHGSPLCLPARFRPAPPPFSALVISFGTERGRDAWSSAGDTAMRPRSPVGGAGLHRLLARCGGASRSLEACWISRGKRFLCLRVGTQHALGVLQSGLCFLSNSGSSVYKCFGNFHIGSRLFSPTESSKQPKFKADTRPGHARYAKAVGALIFHSTFFLRLKSAGFNIPFLKIEWTCIQKIFI